MEVASPAPPRDQARRTRTALPLALVTFAVSYVAMLFTVRWIKPMGEQGWDALAYFVGLLVFGALLVIVIIPIVVFTLGRRLDAATREWSTSRAAMAFGGAGMALGLVAAVVLTVWGGVSLVGALANVIVPGAVAGLATRLLLPIGAGAPLGPDPLLGARRASARRSIRAGDVAEVVVIGGPRVTWRSALRRDRSTESS